MAQSCPDTGFRSLFSLDGDSGDDEEQDFDKVFLPQRESFPDSIYEYLRKQSLCNPYFMQLLHKRESVEDHYWCQNQQCNNGNTELFHESIVDGRCSECNTEVNGMVVKHLNSAMNRYQQEVDDVRRSTKEAILWCMQKVGISENVADLTYQYLEMEFVSYHEMKFDGADFLIPDEDFPKMSQYIGDKRAVQIALKKMEDKLKFGDIVNVDAYGLHFVGVDEGGNLKLITNPCYEGYDMSCMKVHNLTCIPLEITEHKNMHDFISFYRLKFINLFGAVGAHKVRTFPVSMAAVSFQKLMSLKSRLSIPDLLFSLPQDTIFYLESSNFSFVDKIIFECDLLGQGKKEVMSIPIDSCNSM